MIIPNGINMSEMCVWVVFIFVSASLQIWVHRQQNKSNHTGALLPLRSFTYWTIFLFADRFILPCSNKFVIFVAVVNVNALILIYFKRLTDYTFCDNSFKLVALFFMLSSLSNSTEPNIISGILCEQIPSHK